MLETTSYKFGDVTVNHDSRRIPVRATDRVSGDFPYYGASGIVDYVEGYIFDGEYLLVAEDGENLRTRSTPIAFMATGRFWVNNHAHVVTGNKLANTRYLCYALANTDISGFLSGSTQPKLTQGALNSIQVRLPSRKYQDAVIEVLRALEDKIAINERIVKCCDELRRALFANLAIENPLWTERRSLTTYADFVNGRAFTRGATGTGRMVVRIAEMTSGPGASTVYNDLEVPERHLARAGDVLFAWSGSLTVARWFRREAIINQHIFKVIPKDGVPQWLAYELILSKLAEFKGIAADKATTMGHIQRRHLDEPVVAPTAEVIPRLDRQLGPLWKRALAAEQESLALVELRNGLLPGLMSGAIRVRDAEKVVEDAT